MLKEDEISIDERLVVHLLIIGFHHKKGHQIEFSYPKLSEPIDDYWSNIGGLALPDGVHNRNKDLIYFHIPSFNKTLYGIASYRQIDARSVINKDADITRNSIQKSVCLILRRPVYGNIREQLETLTEKYFEDKNFSKRNSFIEFVDYLNENPPEFNLKYYSARDLVIRYRRKTLILFKLLLLQKKVLVLLSPIEKLVTTIMTLVSLIPDLIEKGLNECTLIEDKKVIENNRPFNDNDNEYVNDTNNKLLSLNKKEDTNKLNTNEENKFDLLKHASSITNKLTDAFNRLTTNSSTTNENNSNENYFNYYDQCQFSYDLFKKNNLLHPYLSIHSLDIINNVNVNSYIIGASNGLFRQQNNIDFILTDNDDELIIQSNELKQQLQLTTADLRFTQLFEDSQSNVKSEEEIRHLFKLYFLSLLSVTRTQNEEGINDFNSLYIKSFQTTDAYRLWESNGPYSYFEQILARHPQSGQLNVTDVKLHVAHVLDDTETGRKLKCAFEDTSQFMGEKSRAATKVLGQAKTSIFNSVIGTFSQGKQWLSKPATSSNPPGSN